MQHWAIVVLAADVTSTVQLCTALHPVKYGKHLGIALVAGAGLTGPYEGQIIEQEVVSSDPGLFQMNVTGGKGGGVDGSNSIRV